MNVTTKVHICLILAAAAMAVLNPVPLMAQAPVIQSIVPGNAPSAGYGQMITIQGFNLIQGNFDDTTVTFTKGKRRACSNVFLFEGPSTANELYVRIYNPGGPCDIRNGKYNVTVTTLAGGTSNPWGFQVKPKPQAPIPRKVLLAGDPDCPGSDDYDICVQAYGTDTSGITAVFSQNDTEVSAPPVTTITGGTLGLIHGFKLPELTSGETALVKLRTTVGAVDSDLSFALLFTVP